MKQPLGLIYNPFAGHGRFRPNVDIVLQALDDAGAHVELFATREAGDGVEQGRLAAESHQTIAIYGGDGTVNEVLNGLIVARKGTGKSPRVLLLPGGTMNVLCRELRIPLDIHKAAELFSKGVPLQIYLGLSNGPEGKRYFSLMAGAGIDAATVHAMSRYRKAKRFLGPFAFLLAGLEQMFTYRFPRLEVEFEGKRYPGYHVVVGKSKGYGGFFTITDRADPSQSMLEVALAERPGVIRHSLNLGLAMVGLIQRSPNHRFFLTKELKVHAAAPIPIQMDGDATGALSPDLSTDFTVDGSSVEVLVPPAIWYH